MASDPAQPLQAEAGSSAFSSSFFSSAGRSGRGNAPSEDIATAVVSPATGVTGAGRLAQARRAARQELAQPALAAEAHPPAAGRRPPLLLPEPLRALTRLRLAPAFRSSAPPSEPRRPRSALSRPPLPAQSYRDRRAAPSSARRRPGPPAYRPQLPFVPSQRGHRCAPPAPGRRRRRLPPTGQLDRHSHKLGIRARTTAHHAARRARSKALARNARSGRRADQPAPRQPNRQPARAGGRHRRCRPV